MLIRVSGWSGPSLDFLWASVSSKSGRALSSFPACVVAVSQVAHAGEGVGVVGAELGLPQRQRLLEERQGLVQLPGGLVAIRQVVHALEGVGVVGAELGLHQGQRLLEKRQGLVQLPGVLVAQRQVVHAGEGVGVVGAELGLHPGQRLLGGAGPCPASRRPGSPPPGWPCC